MPSLLILLVALSAAYIFTPLATADPCPFNKNDCQCFDQLSAVSFKWANCSTKNLVEPTFDGSDGTYAIDGELTLQFSVKIITPMSFTPFNKIGHLNLIQPIAPGKVGQEWSMQSFVGPLIPAFSVSNVAGVIPPPLGLIGIADNLTMLHIYNCRENVNLPANSFLYFKKLQMFLSKDTPILRIDDQAFAGLEETLGDLSLINAGLSAIPLRALKPLNSSLSSLNLASNKIAHLDLSDLNGFANLKNVDLSETTSLTMVTISGNEHEVPHTLQYINLRASGIEIIDSKVEFITNRTTFNRLDISEVTTLECDPSVAWMAKHTLCRHARILADNTTCSNGTHFSAYLRDLVPDACAQDETTTEAPTTTPSATTISTSAAAETTTGSTTGPTAAPTTTKGATSMAGKIIFVAMGAAVTIAASVNL